MDGLEALDDREDDTGELYQGILVTFTDGSHRAGCCNDRYPYELADVRRGVSSSGYASFSIGLGGEIDQGALEAIGSNGFASAGDASELSSIFDETAGSVLGLANSFYSIRYCSPSRAGEHRLKIEVKHEGKRGWVSTEPFKAGGFSGECSTED